MITDRFYDTLAGSFGARQPGFETLYLAVGSGLSTWDETAPVYQRDTAGLTSEISRKPVLEEDIHFVDEQGQEINGPSPRIALAVTFADGEAEGSLRECGLFGGDADAGADSGILLSFFVHPRIDKTAGMSLERRIALNFAPTAVTPGQVVTRFLGNSNSRELHDLENETGSCQINEIGIDRRLYFATVEQAVSMGYDRCAYCFGRELSAR